MEEISNKFETTLKSTGRIVLTFSIPSAVARWTEAVSKSTVAANGSWACSSDALSLSNPRTPNLRARMSESSSERGCCFFGETGCEEEEDDDGASSVRSSSSTSSSSIISSCWPEVVSKVGAVLPPTTPARRAPGVEGGRVGGRPSSDRAWRNLARVCCHSIWSRISALAVFSRGGILCRWCACLWAGARYEMRLEGSTTGTDPAGPVGLLFAPPFAKLT
ncbi:hypothetical protein DL93DRAFT_1155145 [Clavulina sp. PMI_390]|nr:hypothetical protein DL93DRAFT_1155145 [Clavulina sp. PMI_390]